MVANHPTYRQRGLFDPRTAAPSTFEDAQKCQVCNGHQSEDAQQNMCSCFPTLYGTAATPSIPVWVFRTPNGKNDGLFACCPVERGSAIGEFVGLVTPGLADQDVTVSKRLVLCRSAPHRSTLTCSSLVHSTSFIYSHIPILASHFLHHPSHPHSLIYLT